MGIHARRRARQLFNCFRYFLSLFFVTNIATQTTGQDDFVQRRRDQPRHQGQDGDGHGQVCGHAESRLCRDRFEGTTEPTTCTQMCGCMLCMYFLSLFFSYIYYKLRQLWRTGIPRIPPPSTTLLFRQQYKSARICRVRVGFMRLVLGTAASFAVVSIAYATRLLARWKVFVRQKSFHVVVLYPVVVQVKPRRMEEEEEVEKTRPAERNPRRKIANMMSYEPGDWVRRDKLAEAGRVSNPLAPSETNGSANGNGNANGNVNANANVKPCRGCISHLLSRKHRP